MSSAYNCASMFCTKCKCLQSTTVKCLDLSPFRIEGVIHRFDCEKCRTFLAISENDEVINVDGILEKTADGWKEVTSNRERIIYYALSQIIYPEFDTPRREEMEAFYDFADRTDCIFLRWLGGQAVGFYTIRPKGTKIIINSECEYSMNTIDTAYIRSNYRNQGLGMEILYDVVMRYQNQDIGFSKPISNGMLQVVKRFLTKHKEYRLHFWEIEDGGIEGSVKLIWFTLRKLMKNQ